MANLMPKKHKKRKVSVAAARKLFQQEEAAKLVDMEEVKDAAIRAAEKSGIVFLDEIDKVAVKGQGSGPDVSREGVQRDILPIVEGSTVVTKYGPVKTDHVLFIAAGAFHTAKPSDLIPELQGRFPIRVELKSLQKEDDAGNDAKDRPPCRPFGGKDKGCKKYKDGDIGKAVGDHGIPPFLKKRRSYKSIQNSLPVYHKESARTTRLSYKSKKSAAQAPLLVKY